MSDTNPAREAARQSDGKFGTQPLTTSGDIDLADGQPVTVAVGLWHDGGAELYLGERGGPLAGLIARRSLAGRYGAYVWTGTKQDFVGWCDTEEDAVDRVTAIINCDYCKAMQNAGETFYPSHFASPSCQSGGRNHCSCGTCF